ncbi:MAG: hypothetical protein IJC12_06265 [Peptococcaceae bacterium]|nr:hypothetical protein [Peptococcaceae bacterium]
MNNNKKKITTVVLLLAFLAIAVTGGTLAYFTDKDSATHLYTAGNVDIDLTEGKVAKNPTTGNLEFTDKVNKRLDVGTDEKAEYNFGKLYPAMKIDKDPTITNLGSEDAYIAAKITIKSAGNLYSLLGVSGCDNIDISQIVTGGLASEAVTQNFSYHGLSMVYNNDKYAVYQVPDKDNNTYVLYFFIEDAKAQNEEVVLFEKLTIPSTWDNAEMAHLKDLKITVDAFATQKYGFASCFDAMKEAFPTQFAI